MSCFIYRIKIRREERGRGRKAGTKIRYQFEDAIQQAEWTNEDVVVFEVSDEFLWDEGRCERVLLWRGAEIREVVGRRRLVGEGGDEMGDV